MDWTYDDFLRRLEAIRNYGSFEDLAGQIPGMESLLRDMDVDIRGQLEPVEKILRAMTPEERHDPSLLEGPEGPSRREAIAERAGTSQSEVDSLIWQFGKLREMLSERSLDEVTRDLMEEATPPREAWQASPEAWKGAPEEEEEDDELELDTELEGELAELDALLEGLDDEDDDDPSLDLTGERLDELLRKISAGGLESLSPSERDELERASAALRAR